MQTNYLSGKTGKKEMKYFTACLIFGRIFAARQTVY